MSYVVNSVLALVSEATNPQLIDVFTGENSTFGFVRDQQNIPNTIENLARLSIVKMRIAYGNNWRSCI